jgi:hypothetical protein
VIVGVLLQPLKLRIARKDRIPKEREARCSRLAEVAVKIRDSVDDHLNVVRMSNAAGRQPSNDRVHEFIKAGYENYSGLRLAVVAVMLADPRQLEGPAQRLRSVAKRVIFPPEDAPSDRYFEAARVWVPKTLRTPEVSDRLCTRSTIS